MFISDRSGMRIISYMETFRFDDEYSEQPESSVEEFPEVELSVDDDDIEEFGGIISARIAVAVRLLLQDGATHASCWPSCENSTHCWLSTEPYQCPSTGETQTRTFHLKGFSPFEHGEIIKACTKNK